jgi:hypothetical protein
MRAAVAPDVDLQALMALYLKVYGNITLVLGSLGALLLAAACVEHDGCFEHERIQ